MDSILSSVRDVLPHMRDVIRQKLDTGDEVSEVTGLYQTILIEAEGDTRAYLEERCRAPAAARAPVRAVARDV